MAEAPWARPKTPDGAAWPKATGASLMPRGSPTPTPPLRPRTTEGGALSRPPRRKQPATARGTSRGKGFDRGDVFALWGSAARSIVPISSQAARERAERRAFYNAGGQGGVDWALTMRSVLTNNQEGSMAVGAARLEGTWHSRQDGELRGRIDGNRMTWEEDGSETLITIAGERADIVRMSVDGKSYAGVLSEDGRLLKWGDGDVWVRSDDCEDEAHYRMGSHPELDDELNWGRWVRSLRPNSQLFRSSAYSAYSIHGDSMYHNVWG
mmetsp:Transcript_84599/g.218002  ORF Transcript_84599/g.218002 Transcript_84599/m.218002 type:complete len:267 (+) Transcript_84599:91-891(+)